MYEVIEPLSLTPDQILCFYRTQVKLGLVLIDSHMISLLAMHRLEKWYVFQTYKFKVILNS